LVSVRILRRYILGEVFSHALLGAALFTFVIFMRDLGRLLEIVVRNSAPIPSVAEIFFLTLPTAFTVTIPMGVLVGILIGLSRLAADSEVTAMRASGLGSLVFVRIITIFAVLASIVALVNSIYIAPASALALAKLQNKLKTSQASFEVQPRVFYEDFKNMVLYVEDVKPAAGAAVWKNVFLADISNPSAPRITLAQQGIVLNEGPNRIRLHLSNGSQQETNPKDPSQYSISTFAETDIPIQLPAPDANKSQEIVPVSEMSTAQLWYRAHHPEVNTTAQQPGRQNDTPEVRARWYLVEFHRRLALPTSCLVLMLVGVPLGLSSKRGGKSMGFVLTILLVFLYYFVSLSGISLGRGGKLPAGLAVWMANFAFAAAGIFLLRRVDRTAIEIGSPREWINSLLARFANGNGGLELPIGGRDTRSAFERASRRRRLLSAKFPLIIDDFVLRDFLTYLGMVLSTFILLTLIFTFFELLGDIIRNKVPVLTLGAYLLNVTPSMIYLMTPLSVLIAVLVTFGLMQKSSELTAMKATGISLYRIILPIMIIAAVVSCGLFFFDQFYIPSANTRQETLRNQIKGKPPQTYLRPDRKWIFGEHNTIYYYEFFDPDQDRFASFSAFKLDPHTFQLTRRVYASRAHWEEGMNKWIFESGWSRSLEGSSIEDFKTFDVATFNDMNEPPGYFKKEVKQSSEMNYEELRQYIRDLQQSGFDVVRLRVQLHKKFAFPVITFIMAVLAVPFSVSTGRKGALTGVAVAIGIAIVYLVTSGLFEAMGNANQLPAALAAWAPDIIFGMAGGYLVLKVPT
jgi:LPS export ABC transporter permease LptF/LPS export ABC transporter permease LptG